MANNKRKLSLIFTILIALFLYWENWSNTANSLLNPQDHQLPVWTHLSTANGDLPLPTASIQQVSTLVLDINNDGLNDFVIASRAGDGPSMVWYERTAVGWQHHIIDAEVLDIEAGGHFHDIDQDGDLDIAMGGNTINEVWWWENPYPNFEPNSSWTRRLIKNSGSKKHHDLLFGDFDHDGQVELVFWNQKAKKLFLAEIPTDPQNSGVWPLTPIYTWSSEDEHEGLAAGDIDQDGLPDIVGGGRWFKFNGSSFDAHIIDITQEKGKTAVGQLIPGGPPEVLFVIGDGIGRLKWYQFDGQNWTAHDMLGQDEWAVHSLEIGDINLDGNQDIFAAQVRSAGGDPTTKMWAFYGNGDGGFTKVVLQTGFGHHESRLADLDGDCDLDILGKPFNWETPRLDIWINNMPCKASLDTWGREIIDSSQPWPASFAYPADLNNDGLQDIVSGGWWYENPAGSEAAWTRHTIGVPLNNAALIHDFDGDGKPDILGSEEDGVTANPNLAWARNDGAGNFTVYNNIEPAAGSDLQGAAVVESDGGNVLEVALSWGESANGLQMLTVPPDPISDTWTSREIHPLSLHGDLSAADIDRDGDGDLLLGTIWLSNDAPSSSTSSGPWTAHTLHDSPDPPDRNRLADINRDGRLDAIVSFPESAPPGKIAWYEQPANPDDPWPEHIIDHLSGVWSLDVIDSDNDGDVDLIAGETNEQAPNQSNLFVYENLAGDGSSWQAHPVYSGDQHQNGSRAFDVDNNGILDIISTGRTQSQVLIYQNSGPLVGLNAAHDIALNQGWNLISSHVNPSDPALESLLADIEGNMVLIKNSVGQVYWPSLTINSIGHWRATQGYQIYLLSADTLTVKGAQLAPQLSPIILASGHNTISYLLPEGQPVNQAFAGIEENLIMVKNGQGEIYWPDFAINQIGDMQPGAGYHIIMSAGAAFNYPDH